MTAFEAAAVPEYDLNPRDKEHVPEIERRLLSCCLHAADDDSGVDDAAEVISANDFAIPGHRRVFEAIVACRRENAFVLLAAVFDKLRKWGARAPDVDAEVRALGPDLGVWLSGIYDFEATGMHARWYAGAVREASLFRQLRGAAAEIMNSAARPAGPADEVLGACERLLFDLTDATAVGGSVLHDAAGMMRRAAARIDAVQAAGGSLGGLATGYCDLDDILGGMRPGQMIVVGGRPGGGKTSLGLNVAANVANAGTPVIFFSMEMGEKEIADRLVAMEAGVPVGRFTKGTRLNDREAAAIARATSTAGLGGAALYLDDAADSPAPRVASVLRRAVRRHGVGLAVIDYLQLMRPENPKENRVEQVGLSARRVKQMARECGVPVVCLCQLNRQVENRGDDGRPKLSDLRSSGEIEQHADVVVLLHTPTGQSYDQPVWDVNVIVGKNRNGPVGDFTLAYRRATTKFENRAS